MSEDWAWPALIQSLQSDIAHLRDSVEDMRRETLAARDAHRKELDALIEQLRDVRDQIRPVVEDRRDNDRLARETRWSWIERIGWLIMGGVALAAWHFLTDHTTK